MRPYTALHAEVIYRQQQRRQAAAEYHLARQLPSRPAKSYTQILRKLIYVLTGRRQTPRPPGHRTGPANRSSLTASPRRLTR
jgi:hypothetical protein